MDMMDSQILCDPAKRAEWVYGQKMNPCPKCGSYDMFPQMPIEMELKDADEPEKIVGRWAKLTASGGAVLEGPCYYMCMNCLHNGPSVNCAGRSAEEARKDPELNREMKRLWNSQPYRK